MNIVTTQEYFNLSTEELKKVTNDYGCTKEDCLILDDGLEVFILDTAERVEEYKNNYMSSKMEVKAILKTTNDKYALIAH